MVSRHGRELHDVAFRLDHAFARCRELCNLLFMISPQHPRALGAGRRGPGEQGQRGDHRSWTQSLHRLSSLVVVAQVATACEIPFKNAGSAAEFTMRTVRALLPR